MASTLALGPAITAVLAALRSSVTLTGYVGVRVYPDSNGDVPGKPSYPYVAVESSSEVPFNTMGAPDALKYGSEARVQIRVGSQSRSDAQANTITSIIKQVLDAQVLTVAGYASTDVAFETLTPMTDFAAGVTTREWVSTYQITVHQ